MQLFYMCVDFTYIDMYKYIPCIKRRNKAKLWSIMHKVEETLESPPSNTKVRALNREDESKTQEYQSSNFKDQVFQW